MLAIERRNEILERLQREKRVVVSELSRQYSVSEETIRRDLEKLENECDVALEQIDERMYAKEYEDSCDEVICYGI